MSCLLYNNTKRLVAVIALSFLLLPSAAFAQQYFLDVVKKYYRVNPFEGKFSSFVNALITDTAISGREMRMKTDTSDFYLSEAYINFNPFSIKTESVNMFFAEGKLPLKDTISNTSSVYSYQIVAIAQNNEATRKNLLKEFGKIKKGLGKNFSKSEVETPKDYNSNQEGEIITYFWDNIVIPPITISWQTIDSNNKKLLAITFLTRLTAGEGYARPGGAYFLQQNTE
jgi:hypothetical protein